ncbi:MAG: class I SAM-dependent methyltransferase [Candidatus Pacebacteria bacterium]|jgi:ubiquinone/menaquinone biosynthesis C-methylase UbiE|nr:class I SAM-dependent methyltransferase [Candidatus Paceibacterota bacterium]
MLGNFSNPSQILEEVGVSKGLVVADFGAGSGPYTFSVARITGMEGKVYALEVQKDLVEKLKSEAEKNHLTNVSPIWCNIEKIGGTKIADNVIDLAIVANVFFQIEDKKTFLKELFRVLKPNGKVLFIDWSDSYGGMGPAPTSVVRETDAISIFSQNGFKNDRNVNAGGHHYGIIFGKN